MFRKKRYKKYTLGRLQLFFQKETYLGLSFISQKLIQKSTISLKITKKKKMIHYNIVTKKKIYYLNN